MPIAPTRLQLRSATVDDALCLGVLGSQVFLDTYATAGIRPDLAREVLGTFSTDACGAYLAKSDTLTELAEYEGHLIGFSQMTIGASHELAPAGVPARLDRLYVQEPFTGQGVGSALLQHAEQAAARAGATTLWLTVWVGNTRARTFYQQRGYQDRGRTWFRFEGESYENRLVAKHLT